MAPSEDKDRSDGDRRSTDPFTSFSRFVDEQISHMLQSIIYISDGDFENAVDVLSKLTSENADHQGVAVAKQNLAVAYLYTGEIERSCRILEQLVDEGYSFQTLTVNLATLYDLRSDKSKEMKAGLAEKIASIQSCHPRRGFVNADFKL